MSKNSHQEESEMYSSHRDTGEAPRGSPKTPGTARGEISFLQETERQFSYQPLSTSSCTRLITLFPSSDPLSDVVITLDEVDLNTQPSYEALSYTWGDTTKKVAIKCNGRDLLVTNNCQMALKALRYNEEPRTLWVDAICIDQSSIDERNLQVRNMGEIYSMAQRVLIWLGAAAGSEPATFDLLRTVEPMLDWNEEATKPYGDVLANALRENDYDAFRDLKRKSWFRRMWCLQEAVLAQDAIVICGGSTIPWSVLLFGVNLITKSEKSAGEYGFGSQFQSIMSSQINARKLLCTPSDAETAISERNPLHESYSRNHMGKFLPVTTLLDIALRREATEPKDRIFGLHSILKKLGVPSNRLPLPNYNRDLVEIYCEAARVAIEEDNCLWILNFIYSIEQRDEDWPSWVPTWVTKFHPAALEVNPFKAAGSSDPKYSFSNNGRRLIVRGKVVDRVMLKAEQSTWLGRVPNWETSQIDHIEEEVNMIKACHEWMILFTTGKVMAQITGMNQYGDDYDHNVAFIRAVLQDFTIVDDHLNKLQDLIHGFYAWQRYLSATNPDSSLPIALLRRTLPPPQYDISTLPEPYQQRLMTDEWTIHRGIQQDEKAALFHTQASIGTRVKSFFITERVFYGTATAAIERGDRIILVAGLRVPLVVRLVDERDDHFRVIGPAFVTGMMEGELWVESEEDLKDITFV